MPQIEQARVQFDFGAENSDEISVTSGEIVDVVRKVNNDWWMVKNTMGQSGLVPFNFLSENLNPPPKRAPVAGPSGLLDDPFGDSSPATSYSGSPASNFLGTALEANSMRESPSLEMGSSLPSKLTSALDAAYRADSVDDISLADMPVPANMTDEERKRFESVREMLNTEKKYCEDLRVIVEVRPHFFYIHDTSC